MQSRNIKGDRKNSISPEGKHPLPFKLDPKSIVLSKQLYRAINSC